MKSGLSDITVILDRSGSMSSIKSDMEPALNSFVEEQKKLPGECVFTLVQFDNVIETPVDAKPLASVGPLTLSPRGGTALLDAVGSTVVATGARFAAMAEADRPERVVVVIITDGMENASREYTRERVAAMVKEQTEVYKWQFIYLGANQDAIAVGAGLGIARGSSVDYGTNQQEIKTSGGILASKVVTYRSTGKHEDFTDQERKLTKHQ